MTTNRARPVDCPAMPGGPVQPIQRPTSNERPTSNAVKDCKSKTADSRCGLPGPRAPLWYAVIRCPSHKQGPTIFTSKSQDARPGRQGWIGSSLRILPEGPGTRQTQTHPASGFPVDFPVDSNPSLPVSGQSWSALAVCQRCRRRQHLLCLIWPPRPIRPLLCTVPLPLWDSGRQPGWFMVGVAAGRGVGEGSETTPPPWERRDGIGNWELGIGNRESGHFVHLGAAPCPRPIQYSNAAEPLLQKKRTWAGRMSWSVACVVSSVLCPLFYASVLAIAGRGDCSTRCIGKLAAVSLIDVKAFGVFNSAPGQAPWLDVQYPAGQGKGVWWAHRG